MTTPASTKELRQQLDEQGLGDVFIVDNGIYPKLDMTLPYGNCVAVYYYVDEVYPTRTDDLIQYLESTFNKIKYDDHEEFVTLSIPDFPYDDSWIDDEVDNSRYH